jgi:preprotein translocase subunit SecD
MRRLIAYLTFIFTIIFGVVLNIAVPLRGLNGNTEYAPGREFIYALSVKNDSLEEETLPSGASDEVASMMQTRLNAFGVSEYQIATEGNDIVRVNATLPSDAQYNRLAALLNYDANFTVRVAKKDATDAILEGEEIFNNVKARIEYRGPHPFIVIPLSDPVNFRNKIVQVAEKIQKENGVIKEGSSEADLVEDAVIVIWSDYDPDKDVYAERNENDEIKKKVFLSFDYRQMWWDEAQTEIAVASQLPDKQDTQSYTTAEIKEATDVARYMVTVFNAGKTKYKIDLININQIYPSTVENLLVLSSRKDLASSKTLIATLVTVLFIIVILLAFYRMAALTLISSGALTAYLTLLIFNAIAVEFSTGALIGLILGVALALFGGLLYIHKFRNEVYRGRTFKKAHTEAIKRSNLVTLDAIVVYVLTGVIAYFLGGAALAGFSVMMLFSGIVALITVLLHNAIAFWLLANNTKTNKNYAMYQIDKHKVPDTHLDEEPTYFGRFANNDYTKKSKLSWSFMGILALGSAITLMVLGIVRAPVMNYAKYDNNITRIYFRVKKNSDLNSSSEDKSPVAILNRIKIEGEDIVFDVDDNDKPVYETFNYQKVEEVGESLITNDYTYYVYRLVGTYTGDEIVSYTDFSDVVNEGSTLNDALYALTTDVDSEAVVSVNAITKQNLNPSPFKVGLVSLVSLAVITLYLWIRHGFSKAFSYFGLGAISSLLVLLFFMMTRISVPPLASLGMITSVLFSALFAFTIAQEHKEIKVDPLYHGLDDLALFNKAEGISFSPLYTFTLLVSLMFLNYVGIGPTSVLFIYASVLLSVLLVALSSKRLQFGAYKVLSKFSAKVRSIKLPERKESDRAKKKKAKKANIKGHKSAEPEEAIFIGIND